MATYYIGWDVGAWHTKTKDGLWILKLRKDGTLERVGTPSAGALQKIIVHEENNDILTFTSKIFTKCNNSVELNENDVVIYGIDACFKFPHGISAQNPLPFNIQRSITNPYLYRDTERVVREKSILADRSRNPLSSIQNAIGSQAAKAQYFLRKFGLAQNGAVWETEQNGIQFKAIETYPATCKDPDNGNELQVIAAIQEEYAEHLAGFATDNEDMKDALLCALTAWLWNTNRQTLYPTEGDLAEGWIWFPIRPRPANA